MTNLPIWKLRGAYRCENEENDEKIMTIQISVVFAAATKNEVELNFDSVYTLL